MSNKRVFGSTPIKIGSFPIAQYRLKLMMLYVNIGGVGSTPTPSTVIIAGSMQLRNTFFFCFFSPLEWILSFQNSGEKDMHIQSYKMRNRPMLVREPEAECG